MCGHQVIVEIFSCIYAPNIKIFAPPKMLRAKINLRMLDVDIILYALVFGGSTVSVTHRKFSYVVGGQLQIFYMSGQQIIIKIVRIFMHQLS